jgi:hypothetical protein
MKHLGFQKKSLDFIYSVKNPNEILCCFKILFIVFKVVLRHSFLPFNKNYRRHYTRENWRVCLCNATEIRPEPKILTIWSLFNCWINNFWQNCYFKYIEYKNIKYIKYILIYWCKCRPSHFGSTIVSLKNSWTTQFVLVVNWLEQSELSERRDQPSILWSYFVVVKYLYLYCTE